MREFITPETIATWKLWLFGIYKIPIIYFCHPKVINISDTSLEVKIRLGRRTRNHLNSMYFGVLSVGADVAGGLLAMKLIRSSNSKISLIFKNFHADFLKRAEGDVHFLCDEGLVIQELIQKSEVTKERESIPIKITAWVPSISSDPVAKFILTLSIKIK